MRRMPRIIHKVRITAEAIADIRGMRGGRRRVGIRRMSADVAKYIGLLDASGRLPWWGYFRADYEDPGSGEFLKLFVYRGAQIGLMQYWDLKAVCRARDWTEAADVSGEIRMWIETKIEDLPEEEDAAIRIRVTEVLNETEKTLWGNVLEEVENEFEDERDKAAAKEVAFLQSAYFNFGRAVKKDKRR